MSFKLDGNACDNVSRGKSIMFKKPLAAHDGVKFVVPTIPEPYWPTRDVKKKIDVLFRRAKERPLRDADLCITVA